MSDIILINPRIGIYNRVFKPFIPLALLSAATYPALDGFHVEIIDQHTVPDWEQVLATALQRAPLCIGITAMTGTQLANALAVAQFVRQRCPDVPIIWGGVHGTLFTEQTIAHPLVDIIVKGEGEIVFRDLVRALADKSPLGQVAGIVYKQNGSVHETDSAGFLELNSLPPVPYELLPVRRYLHTYFYEPDVIEIETSRGCPFSCGFCYNKVFNQCHWRAKSPETVVGTMEYFAAQHGIRNILAIDDSFFVDLRRVNGIVKRIRSSRYAFKFGFQGRLQGVLDMSDRELDALAEAGCRFLQFGVESGSPRILKLINKQLTVEQARQANKRLARYPQISPFYNFIVGFPTETAQDAMLTVDLAWQLLEENPQAKIGTIHIYKEYPGTPLFAAAIADGFAPPQTLEEWSKYDWQSAVARDKSPELMQLFKRITVASYCLDNKIEMLGDSWLAAAVARLYRPISRLRFKHHFFTFMPEARLF